MAAGAVMELFFAIIILAAAIILFKQLSNDYEEKATCKARLLLLHSVARDEASMEGSTTCYGIVSFLLTYYLDLSTAVVRSTAWKHETHMIIPVIYRLITRKHITESYFYLAVSREKHRKQATRV